MQDIDHQVPISWSELISVDVPHVEHFILNLYKKILNSNLIDPEQFVWNKQLK